MADITHMFLMYFDKQNTVECIIVQFFNRLPRAFYVIPLNYEQEESSMMYVSGYDGTVPSNPPVDV